MSRAPVFPLAGLTWSDFAGRAELRGAHDGRPGRGGWRYPRAAGHVHRGVDLKATNGHPVVAVEDGTARFRSAWLGPRPGVLDMAGHRVFLLGRSGAAHHPDGPDGADVNPVRMFERSGSVVPEAAR